MNLRLLLLEDDTVSATFLVQALASLPLRVDWVGTAAAARRIAAADHGLWLFDARLPDGHGADLLPELRGRGLSVPALALTASEDPRELQRLAEAGFLEVLAKPIGRTSLLAAVRRHVTGLPGTPDWDDDAARSALGGNGTAVAALRKLFLQELPEQRRALRAAQSRDDVAHLLAQLHRLKASCAFVGAAGLLSSVRSLEAAPRDTAALARFERAALALEQAPPISPGEVAPAPTAIPTT